MKPPQKQNGPATTRTRLEQRAKIEGERWAGEVRAQILQQRRSASGGWPGTMSEARARVTEQMIAFAGSEPSGARERAARALYHSARAWWLQRQDPD